tara:strand:+ start:284 stop:1054 length:771 start_codon:yes stop_codon:yes gene_type:complete
MKISIIKKDIESYDFNHNLLKPKDNLFSKFWKNGTDSPLNAIVSRNLVKIADKIVESLNIKAEPKDYIITGSIASYNWHSLSDIDLHILFDFNEINENFKLVKRMLDQTRINWNKTHNIKIAGKEVEIYFQHAYEPHEANGIWSLTLEKWLALPVKLDPKLDLINTEKKAEGIAQLIDHLEELYEKGSFKESYKFSGKIKDKIARMRKCGLADEGIYSPENLAFKMLRNSGLLARLNSIKVTSYDKMMSIGEQNVT